MVPPALRIPTTVALALLLTIGSIVAGEPVAAVGRPTGNERMQDVAHLTDLQVFEFRRYTIKPGKREDFIAYFDAYFPEAFEQLGAIAIGQFAEKQNESHFTWLRGFRSTFERPIANSAFYFGPVWREHKAVLNDLMLDSDNVLLLRPLHADRKALVLPSVDPVNEERGATGVAVVQIFPIKKQSDEAFITKVDAAFSAYHMPGVHEAVVLTTLDAPNNFPQLPVRTDGPFLLWIGVAKDEETIKKRLLPALQRGAESLSSLGLLSGEPELVVLNPTHRSRLRWLPSWTE